MVEKTAKIRGYIINPFGKFIGWMGGIGWDEYEDDLLKRINQRIEKAIADSEIVIYIENIKVLRHQEKILVIVLEQ